MLHNMMRHGADRTGFEARLFILLRICMREILKAVVLSLLVLFALPLPVRAQADVGSKALFSQDTKQAVAAFDKMMRGEEKDWEQLALLMHNHARRYAFLMSQLEQHRPKGISQNSARYQNYTAYIHKRTEESEEFARKSAVSWKEGWDLTCRDMLPKLSWKGFPSTRRIALEFLKMENNGETFGFNWRPEPTQDDPTVKKWADWIEEHCSKRD